MEKKDFDQVVQAIKEATDATNRVLDAANLQRHDGPPTRMTAEQKANALYAAIAAATFLAAFWMFTGLFR